MRKMISIQSAALLLLMLVAGTGCARQRLTECREENHLLAEQNDGLKRQLDVVYGDLHDAKAELERTKADLAAARAGKQ